MITKEQFFMACVDQLSRINGVCPDWIDQEEWLSRLFGDIRAAKVFLLWLQNIGEHSFRTLNYAIDFHKSFKWGRFFGSFCTYYDKVSKEEDI